MFERNQKIIDAIIAKAAQECPGALAMIGIYGSFLTGDIHPKSDLDLMILINDERGYCLARTFILEDEAIGHDLYCTTWDALEHDAKFTHPHISKLMDSRIVYCAEETYLARLEQLRAQASSVDPRPFAENCRKEAEMAFAKAMLTDDLSDARVHAGNVLYNVFSAIALLNGRYFRLGTRRIFQEINEMEIKPARLQQLVDDVVSAETAYALHTSLSVLLKAVEELFIVQPVTPEVYPGTYEEMFSNWRNKMYLAVETNDRFLAFDSMGAMNMMLQELGFGRDVMIHYDPKDLTATAKAYDEIIENYRKVYETANITPQIHKSVDAFIAEYEKKKA